MSIDLMGFLGVVMLAYLIPGPDFFVIVRASALRPSLGRMAALGAQTGLCVHMLAAALGLSVVAARSPAVFTAVKLAGAAYLVYLGARAVVSARRASAERRERTARGQDGGDPAQDASRPLENRPVPSRREGFTQGFLTNVLNPKAALFFLSIVPQFIDGRGSMTGQIFLLGLLDVAIGVLYWLVLVSAAARLRTLLNRPAFRDRWDMTTGWLFIAIGIGVAAAE
ncbi:LysE family translocator [Streptomyces sp. NPDC086783]|uniref:LysE family translocator n=1 Tax=Streptomyces sp. NPDC086783 TaxID=3365758 RepID=UPI00380F1580